MVTEQAIEIVPPVPQQFAGKWIAWDWKRTRIIASGGTRQDVRRMALTTGEARPILDRVPDPKCNFLGGCRSSL